MEIETYPINRLRRGFLVLGMLVFPGVCLAGFTASDNFDDNLDPEGDILKGGAGWDWGVDWDVSDATATENKIDGTSLEVLPTSTGGQFARRSIPSFPTGVAGEDVLKASWSFRSDFDVVDDVFSSGGSMSMNLRDQGGDSLITFQFVSGESGIMVNDGGTSFVAGSEGGAASGGVTFEVDEIYDVTFTSVIGSDTYDYTVEARNPTYGSAGSTGNAFGDDRTTETFGSFDFTMTGGTGGGGPGAASFAGHIDNVSVSLSAVPEPTTVIPLGALLLPWFLRRRR